MSTTIRVVTIMADALAGLIWPVSCAGCGRLDVALCRACAASVAGRPFRVRSGPVPIWGCSAYAGLAAAVVVSWKQRGRRDLSGPLGRVLARAVTACLNSDDELPLVAHAGCGRPASAMPSATLAGPEIWLVPMPARRAALRQRGADLVHDLANVAARDLRTAAGRTNFKEGPRVRAVRVLRHARPVRDQIGLDAKARRRNLAGALAVRRTWGSQVRLDGQKCLVIDDIVTTGASVDEAVRVLSSHGAQVVGICSLSVTFRRPGVLTGPERTSLSSCKAPSEVQRPARSWDRGRWPVRGGASTAT